MRQEHRARGNALLFSVCTVLLSLWGSLQCLDGIASAIGIGVGLAIGIVGYLVLLRTYLRHMRDIGLIETE